MTGGADRAPEQVPDQVPDPGSGERLERALTVFLAASDSGNEPATEVVRRHPELRDLLEPMFGPLAVGAGCGEDAADTVLGDYRIVREVARGGMGIVYEAWQRSLDRRVALKVLAPGLVTSATAIARFRREAAAVGRLRHPGIVEVYDFGAAAGQHFFAMQLIDGEPLHRCAVRFRAPAAALRLVLQVVEALQHAHERGIVHRDVKPANILVRADDTAVLTDFGLASDESLPTMTREGGFLGTLEYASPEQVRGERLDARIDVFAVGVVLHELLTGRHPFRAATEQATLRAILEVEPSPLDRVVTGAGADLAAVVARAIEKDPSRRYVSAAALAADLRALQAGEPVSARLPSPVERLRRWTRREPWRAAAVLLLGLGVPAVAGIGGYVMAKSAAISVGELSLAARQRDEAMTAASLAYVEADLDRVLAVLDGAAALAADEEATMLRAVVLHVQGRVEAATTVLRRLDTVGARHMLRAYRLGDPSSAPADPAATVDGEDLDAMSCWVDGMLAYSAAVTDQDEPQRFRAPMLSFHRAVLLAPRPRPTYLVMFARAAARARDRAMAVVARDALLRHLPHSFGVLHTAAMATEVVDLAAAERAFQALADAFPAEFDAHYGLGVVLQRLGRVAEAERCFRRSLELRPDHAMAWNNLGTQLRKRGDLDGAIAAYRRVVASKPDHWKAWSNLGNALTDANEFDEAEAALARALQRKPDYARAHFNLGRLCELRGEPAEAVPHYRRAIELQPDDHRAHCNLANVLAALGQTEAACAAAVKAVELEPDEPLYVSNAALRAVELGRAEPALRFSQRAIALQPRAGTVWVTRAWALLLEPGADPTAACAAAELAVDLSPADPEAMLALACSLAACGELAEAKERLAQVLTMAGERGPALQARIAALQQRLGG